uniref:Putative GIY-YIG homing endonuclease n=1 Tax=Lobochlamys culleus TaxID=51693 RepID=A0A0S2IE32_9CHLO|nr:putative GIY-YIG homing endonuclease [Lobochlamys culleus]
MLKYRFSFFFMIQESSRSKISIDIINKGLQILDDPVLRGSYTLVLTEQQIIFLDKIARNAFIEIMEHGLYELSVNTEGLSTIHLKTDPGKIQNNRPGVYIIKHIGTGMCIVGQTKNFKKRFNQYTSRGKGIGSDYNRINKNFYLAVQEAINNGLDYSQVFQRFVVYSWVDKEKKNPFGHKPLIIDNSLSLKNEINYLEHRLILAFFKCGLSYNCEDVSPIFLWDIFETHPVKVYKNNISLSEEKVGIQLIGSRQAKPFKTDDLFFYSSNDYITYRDSLKDKKNFLAMPALRKRLKRFFYPG